MRVPSCSRCCCGSGHAPGRTLVDIEISEDDVSNGEWHSRLQISRPQYSIPRAYLENSGASICRVGMTKNPAERRFCRAHKGLVQKIPVRREQECLPPRGGTVRAGMEAGRDDIILVERAGLPRVKAAATGARRISLAFFPSLRQIPRAAPSEAGLHLESKSSWTRRIFPPVISSPTGARIMPACWPMAVTMRQRPN